MSPAQWLSWRCGISPAAAADYVRVAGRLEELAATRAALARGEISYWQARIIARVATPETEPTLLGWARYCTVGQLARIAAAFRAALDAAELDAANRRHLQRSLSYNFDDQGFLQLRGRLTPEDGALVAAALRAAEDALQEEQAEGAGAEPATGQQLRADALVRVAEAARAAGGEAEAYQVVLEVDADSLASGRGSRCELREGPVLASETARRLA